MAKKLSIKGVFKAVGFFALMATGPVIIANIASDAHEDSDRQYMKDRETACQTAANKHGNTLLSLYKEANRKGLDTKDLQWNVSSDQQRYNCTYKIKARLYLDKITRRTSPHQG